MLAEPFSEIDTVFRAVDRVIWIVTAANGESRRSGLVATWVNQASIDPQRPLVVVGLAPNHFTTELVDASKAFCLHLLASDQLAVAWQFGLASGRQSDKFVGQQVTRTSAGSPRLDEVLAWLDCRVIARYDAGDRLYFWADVVDGGRKRKGVPLTEQQLFAAATAKQREALQAGMQADRAIHRPLGDAWRQQLGALPADWTAADG